MRGDVLWGLDRVAELRRSHENPSIQACYRDYLGEPLSDRAEQLLHTNHHARGHLPSALDSVYDLLSY